MTLTTRILVYVYLLYVARTLFPLLNMFVFLKKKKKKRQKPKQNKSNY
jgi:hypothetical protein